MSTDQLPIEGRWYIHGPDQAPHYGTLTRDSEGRLQLQVKVIMDRSLKGVIEAGFQFKWPDQPVSIQGFDRDNKPIRLFRCIAEGPTLSAGLEDHSYSVQQAILGLRDVEWHDLVASSYSVHFSISNSWLNPDQRRPTFEEKLPHIVHKVSDQLSLVLNPSRSQDKHGGVTETWWMEFELMSPIGVEQFRADYARPVRLLLGLLTGEKVEIDSLLIGQKGKPFSFLSAFALIERNRQDSGVKRDCHGTSLRSRYRDIADSFPPIVEKWLRLSSSPDMKQVFALYGALLNADLFISLYFLVVAQALEAYHTASGKYSSTKWDRGEFCELMKRVKKALSPSDRAKLKDCLAGANNKSYRQKLYDLVNSAPPQIASIIGDKEGFCQLVKNNRNAHTHHVGEQSHKKRISDFDLMCLAEQAVALLEMLLLSDIDMPQGALDHMVYIHSTAQRYNLSPAIE